MMEDNWYTPGPVHCRQMTEEERQYYQEQRRKRHFPWQSKQGQRDLNGHQWGKHCPPILRFKRKAGHGHED